MAEPPENDDSVPTRRAVSPKICEMGERIAAARIGAGLSQSDLARICAVSQSHISQLEKGTWGPKVNTVMLIATALGVDVRDLLPSSEISEDKD